MIVLKRLYQQLEKEEKYLRLTKNMLPEADIAFLDEISIDEFAKVDLRVAKIKACEPIKKAKKG